MRVLAVDPGSRELGWAVLDNQIHKDLVAYGVCHAGKLHYEERLPFIVQTLNQILGTYKPDVVACEEAIRFKGRSIPALQATVTCIKHWCKRQRLPLAIYNPSTWKKSVIGDGGASKQLIGRIMCLLYAEFNSDTSEHIFDAVAIGLHHLGVEKWNILAELERGG